MKAVEKVAEVRAASDAIDKEKGEIAAAREEFTASSEKLRAYAEGAEEKLAAAQNATARRGRRRRVVQRDPRGASAREGEGARGAGGDRGGDGEGGADDAGGAERREEDDARGRRRRRDADADARARIEKRAPRRRRRRA